MSGDVTYQSLTRLTYMPDRDTVDNGLVIAGQLYYDVYFTGGTISGVTINNLDTPLAIADGGTGQTTANAALNALLPSQGGNAGRVLKTDGTNTSWSADIDTGITQLTGDVTAGPGSGSQAATLATVNANIGSFGTSSQVGTITVNAKGLITAASNTSIQIAQSQVTSLVTDLAGKQPLDTGLTVLSSIGTGIIANTAADSFSPRTLTGTANRILITNGNGVSGNPTFDVGTNVYTVGGTDVAVADGGTNISSYTAGDILYATAATTLTKLTIGGVGRPLVSTGSAPSWGNSISLQSAVATTSGTAVNLSTSIPSGVRRITLGVIGVSTSGTSPIIIQLGSTSFETTGYLGSSSTISASAASSNYTNGFGVGVSSGWGDVNVLHGSVILNLIDSSTNTWAITGCLGLSNTAATYTINGTKPLAGVLDRIRLTTSGGTDTFDLGSASISWEF